jgi:NTP pyrophosphatase (non-canonical NTP hydrolase)
LSETQFVPISPRCSSLCFVHCGHDGDVTERDAGDDIVTRVRDGAPFLDTLINWVAVEGYDAWLDSAVSPEYLAQPLARDITRLSKLFEEAGEALKKFSQATGENPRKGVTSTMEEVMDEVGDAWLTAILGVQHFTKDTAETARILRRAMHKLEQRYADIR